MVSTNSSEFTDIHTEMCSRIEAATRFEEQHPERAYILMAIARKKQNETLTNGTERVFRKVITSLEDIEPTSRQILAQLSTCPYTFRVYLTVNARDMYQTLVSFSQELITLVSSLATQDSDHLTRARKVDSEWISCLHKPQHSCESLFHFDLDDVSASDVDLFVSELPMRDGSLVHEYSVSTPNGYHVVTRPFNYTEWESPVEYDALDRDGMVFIQNIDNSTPE